MAMNTATINPNFQANNSQVNAQAEPSDTDDNSIVNAIEKELGENDDTTVEEDDQKTDTDADADADKSDKEPSDTDKKYVEDGNDGEDDANAEIEIPEKFKNKDGSLNIQKLAKSYKELEPLINQKSDWEKQRIDLEEKAKVADEMAKQQDELAKQFGFDSFSALKAKQAELQSNTQLAQFSANAYAEYLSLCEDPQEARDLLLAYSQNPTRELADAIGGAFSPEVHFKVGEKVAEFKSQLAQYKRQQEMAVNTQRAEEHLNTVVKDYGEWFENKEFANVYALAFQYLGTDLDPAKMFPAMQSLKNSWIKEYEAKMSAQKENEDALNNLEALSPNSTPKTKSTINVDINKMKPAELDKLIGDLV